MNPAVVAPIAGNEQTLEREDVAMRNRCFHGLFAAALGSLLPLTAGAQGGTEYQCIQGDLQRRVVIFYETGVAVPCEVQYFKDTEAPGERAVLWRAQNQSGYCESQAEAFVEQLEGWGWSCSVAAPAENAGDTPETDTPEPLDDTENLAPATPGG